MRTVFAFLGGVLVFFGAACVVAEALHVVVGDMAGWLSLGRVWAGVHGGSLDALEETVRSAVGGGFWTSVAWVLALPSWLVLLVLGLPLLLMGGRGRERSGFG